VVVVGDFYQFEDFGTAGYFTSPGGADGFIVKMTP
jgi:hypothetical protein